MTLSFPNYKTALGNRRDVGYYYMYSGVNSPMAVSPWKVSLTSLCFSGLQESCELRRPHCHPLGPPCFGLCHSLTGYTGFWLFYSWVSQQVFAPEAWPESKFILWWSLGFWFSAVTLSIHCLLGGLLPYCTSRHTDGFFPLSSLPRRDSPFSAPSLVQSVSASALISVPIGC